MRRVQVAKEIWKFGSFPQLQTLLSCYKPFETLGDPQPETPKTPNHPPSAPASNLLEGSAIIDDGSFQLVFILFQSELVHIYSNKRLQYKHNWRNADQAEREEIFIWNSSNT
jgi:hypothetical protein